MKKVVIEDFSKEQSTIKIVIATVAFRMGLDIRQLFVNLMCAWSDTTNQKSCMCYDVLCPKLQLWIVRP